jgi:tryptophan synthase alpha chain
LILDSPNQNRITKELGRLAAKREKALALFITAGFPDLSSTVEFVPRLAEAGADLIEIGMPFSDPLADGPVIQMSSAIALKNGVTIATILNDVRAVRGSCDIPLVMMGYVNPILSYGVDRFFRDAAQAGVDGVILPELPLEESGRFAGQMKTNKLAQILLVTPTTPAERIRKIDAASEGFLYCVARTGVTGTGGKSAAGDYVARVKSNAPKNPVMVGFGISTPDDARRAAEHADGVIVGSALIRILQKTGSQDDLCRLVESLKAGLRA